MAPLYAVTTEDHYDDYKRAETSSKLVGVFSSRERALKVAILRLIEDIREQLIDRADNEGKSLTEALREFCTSCTAESFDVSQGFEKVQELAEEVYGEPEFTMESSGVRYFVQEIPAIDQVIDGEILAEDFDEAWVDDLNDQEEFKPDHSDVSSDDFELEDMDEEELTLLAQEAAEVNAEETGKELLANLSLQPYDFHEKPVGHAQYQLYKRLMAPLYVVTLEEHDDDYKRAEFSSEVVGVFSSKERALKVAILRLLEELKHHLFRNDDTEAKAMKQELQEFCTSCQEESFNVSEGFEKLKGLAEKAYGEPEFTMKSSGVRCFNQEIPAVGQTAASADHIIDGEMLEPEDFDEAWADDLSDVEESEADESDCSSEDFRELEEMEEDEVTLLRQEAAEACPEKTGTAAS
ncbi:hypothetical protein KFL_009750030 [Klebsormidium nitens]|uniref:Uncharacterized protein n=1 Tax=Klebsormidium nitens TaxID=105231 RepID=A0A1Y1IQI8_KLENI|nr:hypothetical protein KFL_009750030 [Klebsormidium nitens]|eukprot:GAQ92312.1 hypothetical protein KFL_009750030 [Klebsormidium nitens]